ncbi:MAG TPA: YfiR family protein [Candidatus Koribacter sp.]|jgi:hypothetical protein
MRLRTNLNSRASLPASAPAVYIALLLLLTAVLLLSPIVVVAQPPATPTETQVEAAFLFKFGSFVTWPNPAPNNTFAICVLGRDPFGPALDSIVKGESLDGVPFSVRHIGEPSEASACRIVFVSSSEQERVRPLLTELAKLPVLTVADMPHFNDRGGMVQFVLENGRVRFEVNLTSAEKSGLTLSSQLLKVASAVKRDGGRD